jgi:hypothetical protein
VSGIADAIGQTFGDLLALPAVGFAGRVLLLALVVLWLATAWWTWRDMESRNGDPLLRLVATAGIVLATPVLFPLAVAVYLILRPPRPEEPSQALELRLTELAVGSAPERCPRCGQRTSTGWQRCPACGQVLSVACPSCGEPVGLDWQLCAWCAAELPWSAPPATAPTPPPAVAIPIVPGGRPLVPVMALPEDEERQEPVAAAPRPKPRARPRHRPDAHPPRP